MIPSFDKKYKTVLRQRPPLGVTDMFDWLHKNSIGDVLIKDITENDTDWMYIGFESPDDALVFRIKYGV